MRELTGWKIVAAGSFSAALVAVLLLAPKPAARKASRARLFA